MDVLLRNVQAVMTFVPAGGEQVRQLLAVIRVWRQQAGGGAIEVDTPNSGRGGTRSAAACGSGQMGAAA